MSELDLSVYEAYVFDFDGTIADTIPGHTKARLIAFDRMAQEMGDSRLSEITPEIHAAAHRHGSNPPAIIGWALQAAGITTEIDDPLALRIVRMKTQAYHELCALGLNPIADAPDFVSHIASIATRATPPKYVGITTTAYRDAEVAPFLVRHGLESFIPDHNIVAREDVPQGRSKPDPYAYQLTLRRAGLEASPERMIVFEDTPGGVRSAKATGATVVGMTTTHTAGDFMNLEERYRPDFVEPGFATLLQKVLTDSL